MSLFHYALELEFVPSLDMRSSNSFGMGHESRLHMDREGRNTNKHITYGKYKKTDKRICLFNIITKANMFVHCNGVICSNTSWNRILYYDWAHSIVTCNKHGS
jgi:hypothetical protein